MLRPILMSLSVTLLLTGCARLAESRLNPLNWFGRSQVAAVADPADRKPLVAAGALAQVVDSRPRIDTVTDLSIDRTPSGAIVRATGVATSQGFFNAQLVPVSADNGVLTYDFRIEPPRVFEQTGSAASRRITAAVTLSAAQLAGVRQIQVRGATNALASSR